MGGVEWAAIGVLGRRGVPNRADGCAGRARPGGTGFGAARGGTQHNFAGGV